MGWTSVSYTVTRNNAVVQGLLDGKGYFFRIAAENIIGMGPFIETDKMVLIKDPICKSERTCDSSVGINGNIQLPCVLSSCSGASGGPDHFCRDQDLHLCGLDAAQVRWWC